MHLVKCAINTYKGRLDYKVLKSRLTLVVHIYFIFLFIQSTATVILYLNFTKHYRTNLETANCNISDHYLLRAKIFFQFRQRMTKKIPNMEHNTANIMDEKYSLDSLQHQSVKYLYQRRLDQ